MREGANSEEKILHITGFPALPCNGAVPLSCALKVPAMRFSVENHSVLLPVRRVVQDPVHLCKRIVNPFCDAKKDLRLGGVRISATPISSLFEDSSVAIILEGKLKLRPLDLVRPDRQDFRAAQRLLDPNVLSFLQDCYVAAPSHELLGAIGYLRFASSAMDSFLNPSLTPCARIESASYALFFAEAWKAHLMQQVRLGKMQRVAPHMVSRQVLAGLRLNAEFLFVWTYVLAGLPDNIRSHIPYAPWLFGSQPCEELFRLLRQMRGYENFDVYEMLKRMTMLQAVALLKAEGIFHFPTAKKAWNIDELCKTAVPLPSHVKANDLRAAAASGCSRALNDVAALVGDSLPSVPAPATVRAEEELCSDDDDDDDVDLINEPVRTHSRSATY